MPNAKFASLSVGKKLRDLRKKKGVKSAQALSKLMRGKYAPEVITRREIGKLRIDFEYLNAFCDALDLKGEERETILLHARADWLRHQGNTAGLKYEYWELRKKAKTACIYNPCLIPSALQTFDYAKAIIGSYDKNADAENDARQRLEWAEKIMLDPSKKIRLACLENAIYTPVGNPKIMVDQLKKLLVFEDFPRVEFRILPDTAFLNVPVNTLFVVFDAAYCICETRLGVMTSEDPRKAAGLLADFEAIWENSLIGHKRDQLVARAIAHYQARIS
jgi:transcriptional regulator with XRE-family HTH domain